MGKVTKTLRVAGMKTNSSVQAVEQVLGPLNGIERATVDLEREELTVIFHSDLTGASEIEAAIRGAGFEVEVLKVDHATSCCGGCGG